MGIERFTGKGVALRKSPRARMNHTVRLQFDDGSLASCGMLSDLSETGARVSLPEAGKLPAKFVPIFRPTSV
jgi:PilZ domain